MNRDFKQFTQENNMLDLFTAAVMFCQVGTDPTYETCEVMHSKTKYMTEVSCQEDTVKILNKMFEMTGIAEKYYVADAHCHNWLSKDSENSL